MVVKLPAPFSELPFYRLSYSHPSPIHRLSQLTTSLHDQGREGWPDVQVFAKREDQAGPLPNYGNKYRKFEYIIPHILSQQPPVTTIVTEGAVQSNHTVQVAGMARHLGLKCLVLLHKNVGGGFKAAKDKTLFAKVGNPQTCHMLGAEVRVTEESSTGDEFGPLKSVPVLDELRSLGEVPYWIPSGASLHPYGGLGYARCAFEILEQEKEMLGNGHFDYIFVACGSGSTLAGLTAGFALIAQMDPRRPARRIVGVTTSRTRSLATEQERISRLIDRAAQHVGLTSRDPATVSCHLDDRFVGERYGVLDSDTKRTLLETLRNDGVQLDPVYTAKVMRGLHHWLRHEEYMEDDAQAQRQSNTLNVLFMHTGGQSAINAYADELSG